MANKSILVLTEKVKDTPNPSPKESFGPAFYLRDSKKSSSAQPCKGFANGIVIF